MARPRKTKPVTIKQTEENKQATSGLLEAIQFVAQAQAATGNVHQTHMMIQQKWAWANNGIISAAHPISDEYDCCPHTFLLLDALKRVGAGLALAVDGARLTVADKRYRAVVPCVDWCEMPHVMPDREIAPAHDRLKGALQVAARMAREGGESVVESSLRLTSGSVAGTDRNMVIEAWHGIDMPTMIVPVSFAKLLAKQMREIRGFGCSPASLTVWFTDGAWLRTQLYAEGWPDLGRVWQHFDPSLLVPVPDGLFTAIEAVAPFGETVFLSDGEVSSHMRGDREKAGATCQLDGLAADIAIGADYLGRVKDVCNVAALGSEASGIRPTIAYFAGEAVRAAIARRQPRQLDNATGPAGN